jgi:hypothetical protein
MHRWSQISNFASNYRSNNPSIKFFAVSSLQMNLTSVCVCSPNIELQVAWRQLWEDVCCVFVCVCVFGHIQSGENLVGGLDEE